MAVRCFSQEIEIFAARRQFETRGERRAPLSMEIANDDVALLITNNVAIYEIDAARPDAVRLRFIAKF